MSGKTKHKHARDKGVIRRRNISYKWTCCNTVSINDFIDLCEELEIKIEKKGDLSNKKLSNFSGKNFLDSYFNEVGLFLVSKD